MIAVDEATRTRGNPKQTWSEAIKWGILCNKGDAS